MKRVTIQLTAFLTFCTVAVMALGCYSPSHSQEYFVQASRTDPALEPLYRTSLYTVYYDHAMVRCVIHSSHTWGQSGGGGGGTGIGIHAFRCDPNRIRERAQGVGLEVYPPKMMSPSTRTNRSGGAGGVTRAAPVQKQAGAASGQPPSGASSVRPPQVMPPAAGGTQ